MAEKKYPVDAGKITLAIRSGLPLTITTYTLPHDMEIYMQEILSEFLHQLGQDHMINYLTYCQQELITNAKKANTKRIYFQEKKLDITNPEDYEKGMLSFKEDTLGNVNYYLEKQKRAGLYIKLILQFRNNKIKLEVRNNSQLVLDEYKRIHDKLCRVQQYTSIEDALSKVIDDSEGAGLGLIIMILMLQKIGLTEDNFQVICENGETITRIILPLNQKTEYEMNAISEEFKNAIDAIPQFPENIARLSKLLSDPKAQMSEIAAQISNDVALTAELLKQVNSAAFSLSVPCKNIADAVKLIGIRGIKNMLYTVGSLKTFASVNGNNEKLWRHAYQVAFYSYNLAMNFCAKDRALVEDSYVCGLLHDMGKIVFENAHPDYLESIKSICTAKGISPEIFEKIVSGVNHGEIGARIAEKWNFPKNLVDVIRYHHSPESAPEEEKTLVSLVNLADSICHYQEYELEYYQIDPEVLARFNITSEAGFVRISEKLQEAFVQLQF